MKVVKYAFLGALVLGGLCAVAAPASADYRHNGFGHNRQELRNDRRELFKDRQELRRDLRNGSSRAEIAQDRREIFQDRRELVHDLGSPGFWGWRR
jgi:hypothetical protein